MVYARMMTRNINQFPVELLRLVLTELKRSSTRERDCSLINSLASCSLWRDIGEELLWTDVVITNRSIVRFCRSTSSSISKIRSLTLTIYAGDHRSININEDAPGRTYRDLATEGSTKSQGLWRNLEVFPAALRKMERLVGFSLVVTSVDLGYVHGFWIRGQDIRAILESLPSSLRHLELNTECAWDCQDPTVKSSQLCPSIAKLLPSLQNIRLRLKRLCKHMMSDSPHAINTTIDVRGEGTMVVNTTGSVRGYRGIHCPLPIEGGNEWGEHPQNKDTEQLLKHLIPAIQTGMASQGLDRNFQQCTIISDSRGFGIKKAHRSIEYDTIFETVLYPVPEQVKHPKYIHLSQKGARWYGAGWTAIRYLGKNGRETELFGLDDNPAMHVEGYVWLTTAEGNRLPGNYFRQERRFRGVGVSSPYVMTFDELPATVKATVKANYVLWKLEDEAGRSLLHASVSDDVTRFEPLSGRRPFGRKSTLRERRLDNRGRLWSMTNISTIQATRTGTISTIIQ